MGNEKNQEDLWAKSDSRIPLRYRRNKETSMADGLVWPFEYLFINFTGYIGNTLQNFLEASTATCISALENLTAPKTQYIDWEKATADNHADNKPEEKDLPMETWSVKKHFLERRRDVELWMKFSSS